jgi:hypothetical protein
MTHMTPAAIIDVYARVTAIIWFGVISVIGWLPGENNLRGAPGVNYYEKKVAARRHTLDPAHANSLSRSGKAETCTRVDAEGPTNTVHFCC